MSRGNSREMFLVFPLAEEKGIRGPARAREARSERGQSYYQLAAAAGRSWLWHGNELGSSSDQCSSAQFSELGRDSSSYPATQ